MSICNISHGPVIKSTSPSSSERPSSSGAPSVGPTRTSVPSHTLTFEPSGFPSIIPTATLVPSISSSAGSSESNAPSSSMIPSQSLSPSFAEEPSQSPSMLSSSGPSTGPSRFGEPVSRSCICSIINKSQASRSFNSFLTLSSTCSGYWCRAHGFDHHPLRSAGTAWGQ